MYYAGSIWGWDDQFQNSYLPISHQQRNNNKMSASLNYQIRLPPGRTFALGALQHGAGGVREGALVSGRWRRSSLLRQSWAASYTWLRRQRQGGGRSRGRSWKRDELTLWLGERQEVRVEHDVSSLKVECTVHSITPKNKKMIQEHSWWSWNDEFRDDAQGYTF